MKDGDQIIKTMGSHQSPRMVTDDWLTPPEIILALGTFDLDPCAVENMPWQTAKRSFTRKDDGLTRRWRGRVWLNPPYGRQATKWLDRMARHGRGTALTFARTETKWFVQDIWERATACLFLHGRIHFHHLDGTRAQANAGAPSVLVAYGAYDAGRLMSSGLKGSYCTWSNLP